MKRFLVFAFLFFSAFISFSQKEEVINYSLPDTVRAISFVTDISVSIVNAKKEMFAGIRTDVVKLSLESDKKQREVVFEFPEGSAIMANGIGVKTEKDELSWKYSWKENENYKLMIATAGDSAGNFSLYSGYIFLPTEKKWKLIGTCKIPGQWNTLKQLSAFYSSQLQPKINEAWAQRSNGSWKNLMEKQLALPVVNLFSHIDSLEQLQIDKKQIESNVESMQEQNGIYYTILKEGTGKQVSVNDTVVAFYKGYLLTNNSVFDETKDRPATFPLNRLIRGWQIGVPFCKVGGKIKLIIPSNLAYSIRTRAAKIPPNSILVFEIEVVDAKSPQ